MPATSQAAINRRAAGLDPLPDPEHSARSKKAAAKRHGKDVKRSGGKLAAKGNSRADTSRNAEKFLLLSLDSQRVRSRQTASIASNAAPEVMQRIVNIAMGKGAMRGDVYVGPGYKEQIAAARLVFDVAQVTGAQAESTSKARDATLNEVEVSDLRALLDAIETAKAQQTVTVEGQSARVSADWRQATGRPEVADAEILAESTDCAGSMPDVRSAGPFGADGSTEADGTTGKGQAGG